MNLRTVDLNLLVVLRQLLAERHVSHAAEALGMSQPAVSRALQRLRDTFDDPLLVRTQHGYDLSARAAALMPELDRLLDSTARLISGPTFDPSTSAQTVRFYGPDPEIGWFMPALFERMRNLAPHMALEARSDPMDHFALLESGEVHFVMSALEPSANTSQLRSSALDTLNFVLMMRADHPLARGRLTMKEYLAASHAMISLTGRGTSMQEDDLIERGHLGRGGRLDIALRLTSFTSVAAFCERSDILFHLPRRFAEEMAKGRNIALREPPADLRSAPLTIRLYWHERHHKDPMCVWIRDQLRELKAAGALSGK